MEKTGFALIIDLIADMPNIVMRQHGILPEGLDDNCKRLFKLSVKRNQTIAQWLRYYLLDKTDLLADLTFSKKVTYKPAADYSIALLNIMQEIYLRSEWIQNGFPSPAIWWLASEHEGIVGGFNLNGLLGTSDIVGKNKAFDAQMQKLRSMEDAESRTDMLPEWIVSINHPGMEIVSANFGGEDIPLKRVKPLEAVEIAGIKIAAEDIVFRNNEWRNFSRKTRKQVRLMRNNKNIRACQITKNGDLWIGGRGKRSKGKSKGFKENI